MMNTSITIPAASLTGKLTVDVTVTGIRSFRVRAAIGIKLIELAAWLMGMRCEVDVRS